MEKETLKHAFGLNKYESSILFVVFKEGKLSIGEMSKLCDVPRSRMYDITETLEKKGFIRIVKKTRPIICKSVKLERMFLNFKKRLIKDAENKISYCKKVLGVKK